MGDAEQAVIRLRLRKPPHWRWALHTSRSAPAVTVLEDGAGRDSGGGGGAPAGGVELLVDVAEASERRCSPRVRAILADEGLPVSRSASARLRSAASGGNAVLKQKSDSSLERRAKGTGFGLATPRVPSTSDVPKEERSDSHSSSTTGDRTPSARVQNQQTAPGCLEKPETGEAKFQSRIARPVPARKTLPDASGASAVEQSRLPCLRSASRDKSGKPADVTKRYSDSSLGSLSKVMKLRNRLSQSSTGTDTPDATESVLSDSSVPTVRCVSGSPSVTGSDSAENVSVMKELPSRVPVQHKSVSCRSSSVKETKKRYPSTNSLRREVAPLDESQQLRRSNRNKNDLHYKIRKEVPTQAPTDSVIKSQPASIRKERTSDTSKDCSRKQTNTRSQGVQNMSSQRSQQPSIVEETKRIKQPQQRSTTLPEVQPSYHRKPATSRSKVAAAERKQACVKKQKSDSSLDSTFSSTAAEGTVRSKSKIPLGHTKLDATARNLSHLATGAYGTHRQLASVHPVGGGTANKPLRPTIIPRLACSSEKLSGGGRRVAETESTEMSSSVEELDAVNNNVSRASSVKCEGQRSPRTRTEDMDDVCLDVSVEVASCGGNSGSRGRSPECDAMYVAYVVTTPDSEIGAPVYRVDSPSVSSVCDVKIVPFDDDLEAEPVFRPARRYFGYGGSFKRLSDLDEKDLAADRSERRSSSFGSRPSRPCSNSGSSASGSVDTNKPGQRTGQYSSRLEKLFRDRDVTSSPGKKTVEQSLTKSTEDDTTRRKTSCKQSNIPRIRVSPQKEDVKKASGKRNPKHSAGLYSYLLKYRPSGEQFSDPEVLSVATETVSGISRTGHARGDSGVYSLNGSMRDRNKQRLAPPAVEEQQQQQQQKQKQQQSGRKRRRRHRRRAAEHQGCGGCDVGGGEAMGSSASRQPGGLAGRRAHSSGSLPRTAGAASAMAASSAASTAGPAPGARGRSCGGGGGRAGKLCKDRAKLCGSLPNHLDCNDASNGLDQGYGSERSPDDEEEEEDDDDDDDDDEEEEEDDGDESTCHCATYPFLNTDSAFEVHLVKGSRGLGLSVCGGADSSERWPGLVRVKRLFPQQPAWLSGRLQPGDILLAANGVSLVGLTDYQALEVLRRTPSRVSLRVVRPPGSLVPAPLPAPGQPPPPPRRDAHLSHQQLLPPPPSHADDTSREFDIVLTKVNRSLGFTLRKEDESVLGHYVRALVREPALSDGRIRPGDKIVAVNDVDISPMSHEEAVMFLRQCGDVVKLRLYRDESQTPVSALSPTEEEKPFKPKPLLRKEARDMLTDLAVRKMSPGESSYSGSRLRRVSADSSPCSSPRRRHLTRSSPSENKAATLERMPAGQKYMVSSQSQTSTSDSSEEHSQNNSNTLTCSSSADADADSTRARGHASSFSSTAGSVGEPVKPLRPNFLDLCGAVGSITPQTRKPRLVFGSSGEAEWEEDEGDPPPEPAPGSPCPRYSSCCSSSGGGDMMPLATDSVEPVSMPPLSSTSSTSTAFSYRNPAYQSAVDATGHRNQSDRAGTGTSGAGAGGLLKWKGVVFTPEDGNGPANGLHCPPEAVKAQDAHLPADYEPGDQIFMVELTRGWNSRLGFSLQGNGQHTYISAIYADSVAAKDGRLQAGDRVLMVNDENVETMSTADVIDLLRKIRGTIGITVLRKHKQELTTPTT